MAAHWSSRIILASGARGSIPGWAHVPCNLQIYAKILCSAEILEHTKDFSSENMVECCMSFFLPIPTLKIILYIV